MEGKTEAGKGDTFRPVDRKAYEQSYTEIFGEKPIKTWIPDPEDDPRNKVPLNKKDNDESSN